MFRKSKKILLLLHYNTVACRLGIYVHTYMFYSIIFNINSIGALQERIAFHKRKIYFKYKLISTEAVRKN